MTRSESISTYEDPTRSCAAFIVDYDRRTQDAQSGPRTEEGVGQEVQRRLEEDRQATAGNGVLPRRLIAGAMNDSNFASVVVGRLAMGGYQLPVRNSGVFVITVGRHPRHASAPMEPGTIPGLQGDTA